MPEKKTEQAAPKPEVTPQPSDQKSIIILVVVLVLGVLAGIYLYVVMTKSFQTFPGFFVSFHTLVDTE